MENKKDLAKIALAALILASAAPINGYADAIETDGTLLAVGCAAHGCPAKSDPSSVTLTEAQLLGLLSPQGRTIYLNLDPEGKALAIQLASQDSYRDKNLAIQEAQRRINERRGQLNR